MNDLPVNISENLHFLIAEVSNQLDELKHYMGLRTVTRAQRVMDRKGYAENLMLRIQNSCVQAIAETEERRIPRLRAVQSIAADLERISTLSREAITQMSDIDNRSVIRSKGHLSIINDVLRAISQIEDALQHNDTQIALKIGELERKTDHTYSKLKKNYTRQLKRQQHIEDHVAAIIVAHTLERMGDLVLDIGEALLFGILGQPMDLDRYHALMESLDRLSNKQGTKKISVEPIAETRSGSGISGISQAGRKKKQSSDYVAVYKDGLPSKLREERAGVESWHDIYPGLAPRILSYRKHGDTASLLIEHLAGMTFEQILINESDELLQRALKRLAATQNRVWKETRQNKPVAANFMQQLDKRSPDVFAVHSELDVSASRICGFRTPAFMQLVSKAQKLEKKLKPPFSVYIHGDFNVDNIIYDPHTDKISYIDLHRSRYTDYVQDVSVFMVSNYRLQIMDAPVRQRIMQVVREFYKSNARFAKRNKDATFEIRLALGLIRSFVTSTRFILDKSLATNMFLQAKYLLEQITALEPKQFAQYRVPVKELFIG